jgi:replicative DNA helicase
MLREPPYSSEAEKGILGSILLDPLPSMLKTKAKWLEPNMFFDRRHQLLYASLLKMHDAGVPMDAITIGGWLKDEDALGGVGGYEYLSELQGSTIVAAHVNSYCDTVVEKYKHRLVIDLCTKTIDRAFREEDANELIQQLSESSGIALGNIRTLYDVARDAYSIDEKIQRGESFGLPFPWRSFQLRTFGIPARAVTPFAGRDGKGKSRCASYLTHHWVRAGIPILYFPFEDTSERLLTRMAATHGGYDTFDLRRRQSNGLLFEKHAKCLDEVSKLPLYVHDRAEKVSKIAEVIAYHKTKYDIQGVVIDGFKDIIAEGGENQTSRENGIMATLVEAAKAYDVAIVTISHLTKVEDDHWISKQYIKGSGTQTQSARMVLVLQDSGFPAGMSERWGDMGNNVVLDCVKSNYGDTGVIVLEKDLEHGRFVEVEEQH